MHWEITLEKGHGIGLLEACLSLSDMHALLRRYQGDSGGPLVCNIGGKYHLAGLTSYGLNGCYLQAPTVYTRVSYYRSWIAGIAGM